jgi:hypothetical protein
MVFTPATGVSGPVTYTFVATDHHGTASAPATATVRVDPVARPVSMTVRDGSGPVTIVLPAAAGTGPFTCALVNNPQPSEGTATLSSGACRITFTLAAWSGGAVDFLYSVTDATGLTSAPATVAFNVLAAATTWNGDPTSPPDTGAHLRTNALGSGSLVTLGLLLLVLGIRTTRRDKRAGTTEC